MMVNVSINGVSGVVCIVFVVWGMRYVLFEVYVIVWNVNGYCIGWYFFYVIWKDVFDMLYGWGFMIKVRVLIDYFWV